jgi:hypothetical protein
MIGADIEGQDTCPSPHLFEIEEKIKLWESVAQNGLRHLPPDNRQFMR